VSEAQAAAKTEPEATAGETGRPAAAIGPEAIATIPALATAPELEGVPAELVRGTLVLFPTRQRYVTVVHALRSHSFAMCSDLCGVDYLRHLERHVADGIDKERFEVVVTLLSLELARRVRLRVQVPEDDPVISTIVPIYPGSEAMERELYDMFGIRAEGHPDLTRILMPEDWEGHPLRKDYSPGRVPVQFKQAPGPR
jgi:NADH-quinone oxidoreductase subunit C